MFVKTALSGWEQTHELYVKVSGNWEQVSNLYHKSAGMWREIDISWSEFTAITAPITEKGDLTLSTPLQIITGIVAAQSPNIPIDALGEGLIIEAAITSNERLSIEEEEEV